MLVGITLPSYSIHTVDEPWNYLDTIATVVAVSGLLLAGTADNQLRAYMLENEELVKAGKKKKQLLNSGVWKYR